jgi:putative ABC transport system permease protein
VRTFRLLVLRRLRQGPMRAATTILSIAAGVSLAVSITVLIASIDRSLEDFGRGLAGPAPLRVTGATLRGGLPNDAVEAASDVAGVAEVVPMVQTVGRTQQQPGDALDPALVLGVDCRIEALFGPIGCDQAALDTATGPVALGPEVSGGPDALLRTDVGRLPLGDAPVLDSLVDIGDGRVVVLPLAVAQERFTRPGQVDVAYVLLEPSADTATVGAALQAAVGPQFPVKGATDPPAGASAVLGAALPIYSLLGIFALGIGAVLVANTAAMSLEARRRELAVLGALGGRRRTVVTAAVSEMALLGAVGGLLGSAGGAAVAAPIVSSFSSFTEEFTGASLSTHVPSSAVVIGLLLGALLGGGAALWPARRATRFDVAAELSGRTASDTARTPRLGRRVVLWLAVAMLGVVGCWGAQREGGLDPWQAAVVTPAFLAALLGMLFATVAAAPLLLGRVAPTATRYAWAPLRLAVAAASRDHRRTGLLAVTVGAAVVTAFVTEGTSASARASIEASIGRNGAGIDVSTMPFDDTSGPDVPPSLVQALASVPGVAEVSEGRGVVTGMAEDPIFVQAITGNRLTWKVIDGEASAARLAAGDVLIGAGLARSQQIRAGDEVRVATPSGDVHLPVQGVWEDGNNVGSNVTMSPSLLEELFGPQPTGFVALRTTDGVSEADLARNVAAADLDPELRSRSSATLADDIADEVDAQFASFRIMQQALLAVLFAAVLSSLLLAAVQRRQEMALLAAVGTDPPSLARLLLVEAGLVALCGVVLSLVMGPITMFSLTQVLPFIVGFRDPVVFDWPSFAVAGAVAVVVALVGAAWPARRAAQVEVLEALRYE